MNLKFGEYVRLSIVERTSINVIGNLTVKTDSGNRRFNNKKHNYV